MLVFHSMASFTSDDILYDAPLLANDPLRFWFNDKFFIDMGITIATDEPSTTNEARLPADEQESLVYGPNVSATQEFVHEVTEHSPFAGSSHLGVQRGDKLLRPSSPSDRISTTSI